MSDSVMNFPSCREPLPVACLTTIERVSTFMKDSFVDRAVDEFLKASCMDLRFGIAGENKDLEWLDHLGCAIAAQPR